MICMRCRALMVTSHHQEAGDTARTILCTEVYLNECPECSAIVKIVLPMFPETQQLSFRE